MQRKRAVVLTFVDQAQRHLKLFLGFIGEADDDIGRERTARNPVFNLMGNSVKYSSRV